MSVTVNTQPPTYAPLNAAVFKVTSDRPDILQFKINVYDADSGLVMGSQKYAVLPMYPSGTTFNLAPLLASFVDYQLVNNNTLLVETPNLLKKYHVEAVELYRDATTDEIVEGASLYIPSDFYVWCGIISPIDWQYYDPEKYIANPGGALSQFLSTKPLITNTYHDTTQYLYLMSNTTARVEVKTWARPNTLINTYIINGVAANKAYRFNASIYALMATYGPDIFTVPGSQFTDPFTPPFGSPQDNVTGRFYTVRLIDASGNALSETRTYAYNIAPCAKLYDLTFQNAIGGYDSLTMRSYKESVATTKSQIAANAMQLNDTGDLVAVVNNVFNPDTVNVSSDNNRAFSIISDQLNDDMRKFAEGVVLSDNVLVRTSTGDLYPVQIVETNYDLIKTRTSTDNNRLTVSFKINDTNIIL